MLHVLETHRKSCYWAASARFRASERRLEGARGSGERARTFSGRGKKRMRYQRLSGPFTEWCDSALCAPCCCLSFWRRGKSAACVEDHCRKTHKRGAAFTFLPDPFICPVSRLSLSSLTSSSYPPNTNLYMTACICHQHVANHSVFSWINIVINHICIAVLWVCPIVLDTIRITS